jgi:hypothetical protein
LPLLVSNNAPFKQKDKLPLDRIYPLPGYVGQGIIIEYNEEKILGAGLIKIHMLIPSNNPDSLCEILTQKYFEHS